jgi:hypothetical protein
LPQKHVPSPETIGSLFEFLFESRDMWLWRIGWPPDAFCFAATALQRSSAYTALVGTGKPKLHFKHRLKNRAEALEEIGAQWRTSAAEGKLPPKLIREWFDQIRARRNVPLSSLAKHKRTLAALTNLLAAADESCEGLGISLTSSDNDQFTTIAEAQLLPTAEKGSTLCRNIHPSRARVLPKCHTAQTGLTIRSFSHFLALASSSEIRPEWYSFCDGTSQHALNLLLITVAQRGDPKTISAHRDTSHHG